MPLTNRIEEILEKEARRQRIPLYTKLELLPACNLNCKMCYVRMDMTDVRRKGGLIPVEKWLSMATEMRDAGTLYILLTGGEVFMYPGFRTLYEELYQMGFHITINTNATLIDEEVVEWLNKMPPKLMSISLYGASDDTYQALCGQSGMFERIDKALRLLKMRGIRMELKTILNPLNVHDADKMSAYARSRGIFYLAESYAYPPSRKASLVECSRFSPQEAALRKIEFNYRESTDREFVQGVFQYLADYEKTRRVPGEELFGFTCAAGNSACWVNWQGNMTPCVMMEEPSAKPFEIGFKAAWQEIKEKCDRIHMSSQCSNCEKRGVCTVCPAANLAETGSFEMASSYHCEMTKAMMLEMNRMVKTWGVDIQALIKESEGKR